MPLWCSCVDCTAAGPRRRRAFATFTHPTQTTAASLPTTRWRHAAAATWPTRNRKRRKSATTERASNNRSVRIYSPAVVLAPVPPSWIRFRQTFITLTIVYIYTSFSLIVCRRYLLTSPRQVTIILLRFLSTEGTANWMGYCQGLYVEGRVGLHCRRRRFGCLVSFVPQIKKNVFDVFLFWSRFLRFLPFFYFPKGFYLKKRWPSSERQVD